MKVYIYTLEHPVTKEVRYIGKTKNPKERFHNHCNKLHNKHTHKRNWINSLRNQGLKPKMNILDEVTESEWKYWEKFWIEQFRQWGFNLVNHTSGGDGLTTGNQTSFKKGREPWNKGLSPSLETRNQIRESLLGKPSNKKKQVIQYSLTDEIIQVFDSATEAAEFIKGSTGHIVSCCNGSRNTHKKYKWKYKNQ
jgi:predicted GIY-YIG superfamily endonuclease